MENTLENKAKFFAQYWGQEVLRFDMVDKKSPQSRNAVIDFCLYPEFREYNSWTLSHSYILLTPLTQIADEDAIYLEVYGVSVVNEDGYHFEMDSWTTWRSDQADYLRSKGYSLPWMGLSVEQQIEYGWVKLNEGV